VVLLLAISCLVIAIMLACFAPRYQRYMHAFERSGGMLFVGGLMLLGTMLPRFY